MKRILVLSFFPAFTPPSNGGESRLYNFYMALSRVHHITLLSSSYANKPEEVVLHGSNFVERRIPKDEHFFEQWNRLLPFSSGGDLSGPCITACGTRATLLHDAYLEEYSHADIIIHESPFTIGYDLFFSLDSKLRVYNSHNCETNLYEQLHSDQKSKPIWDAIRDAETKLLLGCDVLAYCSESNLEDFEKLAPNANYRVISASNGMSPIANISRPKGRKTIESVIFIGSGHPPNEEAAKFIVTHIAPKLPLITFHILGNCLPKGSYPRNIKRHGFVEDDQKKLLLANADLAINPMMSGSGSNVKVFDLFSHGVPVLSSAFGMRGTDVVDKKHCLVCPVSEFVAVIETWKDQYDQLQEIGLTGKNFASENYSWDVIAREVALRLGEIDSGLKEPQKYVVAINDYNSFIDGGGGGVRTRGIYYAVSEWSQVIFLCFSADEALTVTNPAERIAVVAVPKTQEHLIDLQNTSSHYYIAPDDIVASRHATNNTLLSSIYACLRPESRITIVEHPYLAGLPVLYGDRFIYSSQNNETVLKRELLQHHPLGAQLISEAEEVESLAISSAALTLAVSDEDAVSFTQGRDLCGPIIVVPNGGAEASEYDEDHESAARRAVSCDNSVVFVGSAHIPNIEAMEYLVNDLAPQCSKVNFHIIGSMCESFQHKVRSNVHLWGVLDEQTKAAVMQACTIAINPVITGGGSNIKLADYFANGLYVLTTDFGTRGYPQACREHALVVTDRGDFLPSIDSALNQSTEEGVNGRLARKKFFQEHLSMNAIGSSVIAKLKNLERRKKQVLCITYRYTNPAMGGAEVHFEKLIEALSDSNDFQIDVVAPAVSKLDNIGRFSEDYSFDEASLAKVGLENVRYARFPLDKSATDLPEMGRIWKSQPQFEKILYTSLRDDMNPPGLAWGWGDAEGVPAIGRWAFTGCGIYIGKPNRVRLTGFTVSAIFVVVKDEDGRELFTGNLTAHFDIDLGVCTGAVEVTTSTETVALPEVRPLAFFVTQLMIGDQIVDLSSPTLLQRTALPDNVKFEAIGGAATEVRDALGLELTAVRGPFSKSLELYIENNISQYDLVVTHNNIFRPAVFAVACAKKYAVPVISIPHAHLDDDFYHFPDVKGSILHSDLALIAPKLACGYYSDKGANAKYHAPGIDTREVFSSDDVARFQVLYSSETPFFLVLGRKSAAKGYQLVLNMIAELSGVERVHLVMIGPDDDGRPVNDPCVTYLGRQPRSVVRGALRSCIALVNMSTSESFGIVLLEAWMARKPVIVNGACAAFHDLAVHKKNALIVSKDYPLKTALSDLLQDSELCARLGREGQSKLKEYDWETVGSEFVQHCISLTGSPPR